MNRMGKAADNRKQADHVEDRSVPRTPVIYEVVRRHGEAEMARPPLSLWWSGVAAGLSISFSLVAEAILHHYVPHDLAWRELLVSLGYPVGFLMAVLSRQQLFTENTITVVLPVMARPSAANFGRLARMWSIVLAANISGTLFAALFCTFAPVVSTEFYGAMLEIAHRSLAYGWYEMLFRAVSAGFLIAAMVWILPSAQAAQFHVIALMTYLVAVGGFAHIVAGSMEAFLLLINGDLGLWSMLSGFTLPVLLGNIVGGTALFALISYAQVMQEI